MITRILHTIGYVLLKWPPVSRKKCKGATYMLRSGTCVCGERKLHGWAFCKVCWASLPQGTKEKLSRVLRRGFIFTYFSAAKQLRREHKAAIEITRNVA
jgi:hypothetical protein